MKRTFCFVALALFTVFPTAITVSAQSGSPSECDPQDVISAIEAVEGVLANAKQAAIDGNLTTALDLLTEVSRSLVKTQAQCLGWYFEGNGSDVFGPLELSGGVYILEYSSSVPSGPISMGTLTIDFESVDSDEWIADQVLEMRMEAGEFSGRKTIRLDGGRYLISVEVMYLGDWAVQLVKP